MNVLLISFSGRKSPGNCENTLNFLWQHLKGKGLEVSRIEIKELEIHSCLNCDYQCSEQRGNCPINDDVQFVYDQILVSDLVIFAVPTYFSAPPSRYFAWRERSFGVFTSSEQYNRFLDLVKGFVVFGKADFGGQETIRILRQNSGDFLEFLLIENDHYDQSSTEGKLLDLPEVQAKLVDFTEKLLQKVSGDDL